MDTNNDAIGTVRKTGDTAEIEGYWVAESNGEAIWHEADDRMGSKPGRPFEREIWTYAGMEKP